MASIASAIDFFGECMQTDVKQKTLTSDSASGMKSLLAISYAVMTVFLVCMSDYAEVPGLPMFSYTYFTGSALQFFSYVALAMRIKQSKAVDGISSQSLLMHAISLFAKLGATATHDGYLPADKTGDVLIQIMDCCSLLVVIYNVYLIHKPYVHTYQPELDDLPIRNILLAAGVLAMFLHGDLDRCFWMDSLWAFGLNVEVFQMLPQLHLLVKVGGAVDNTTAHYVVNQFLACVCRLAFWIWAIEGCEELSTPEGYGWGMAMAGIYILAAYGLQILINLDFVYYYVKARWQGGKEVVLPKDGLEAY